MLASTVDLYTKYLGDTVVLTTVMGYVVGLGIIAHANISGSARYDDIAVFAPPLLCAGIGCAIGATWPISMPVLTTHVVSHYLGTTPKVE